MVICILASSDTVNNTDIHAFLRTFCQITEYTQSIILSVIHEPNLEPNLLVTTVLIVGWDVIYIRMLANVALILGLPASLLFRN